VVVFAEIARMELAATDFVSLMNKVYEPGQIPGPHGAHL
jgi:hypothetical protein